MPGFHWKAEGPVLRSSPSATFSGIKFMVVFFGGSWNLERSSQGSELHTNNNETHPMDLLLTEQNTFKKIGVRFGAFFCGAFMLFCKVNGRHTKPSVSVCLDI